MSSERTPLLSGSVNGPNVNKAARTVQDNMPSKGQRIQMAQAVGAIQAGKLPSQAQISKMLQIMLQSDTLKSGGGPNSRTARLGNEGAKVLDDFKGVLRATKTWGEAKNGDDLLQNFFYNAATADLDVDVNAASPPSQKEMSQDSQRAIASLRSIASLLVTSPEFRSLASDFILLSRDLLADAASAAAENASKAANKMRPSEQERKEGVDFDKLQQKGKKTAKGAQSGKLQGEIREGLWDEVEDAKQYLDEKLPEGEEARDRMIAKLQEVVTQAQKQPEYRRAISTLVNLFKKYGHKAEDALKESTDKSQVSDEDEKVQQAGRDLRTFVERVSGKNLDDLVSAGQKAADDVQSNDKLSAYFNSIESFFDRLLYQPGYVVSPAASRKASSLYDDGQSLLNENTQWKQDAAALQKELEGLVNGIANDDETNKLVDALENLGSSLASAGQVGVSSLKFGGEGLYRDLMDVMVPRMIGLVKEIPVPRIEFKSEDIDLVIDDVKFESASFIPDSIRFVQHNDLRFTQGYATYASEYDGSMRLAVEGLHISASNIAFWISKKTGLFPFQDAGLLDLQFGPKGLSFDVTLENANEDDQETFFVVKKVDVALEGFDYSIRDNDKWFATWFAKPVIRAVVRRNIVSALETQIAEYLHQTDFRLFALQQRAIAATNAKPSPSNFVNAIMRDSIFPQSSDSGPIKVRQAGVVKYGRHGEFVLHVGVDEHLFPTQPPARVSNKQREKLVAQSKAATRQASGAADQFKQQGRGAAGQASKTADGAKKEGNELDAKRKEQERRDQKSEGWRSDAFEV